MDFNFKDKTVVVTGGTRGIGLAIVKLFEKYKAKVIATGTSNAKIKELNKINNKTQYFHLDFTSDDSIKLFLKQLQIQPKIDVLINNAGVNKIDSIIDIDIKDWDWINNINLRGPFLVTREIIKNMILNTYGKIINISSIFGVISKAKRASYSSTKWGLIGLTKSN